VVTYTVGLRNTGTITATGAALSLPLPAALGDVAYTTALEPGVTLTPAGGQSLAWTIGDLPPGAGGTVAVTARLSAELNTTAAVTATISADDDFDLANNTATASLTVGNRAPSLAAIVDAAVAEGAELRLTAAGSDSDLPAQMLTFSLAGAPAGASIDPSTGVFTWTPTGSQGPGSYTFAIRVSDGALSAEEELTVTVRDQDLTYSVAAGHGSVGEGESVSFTVTRAGAIDAASTVAYQFGGGATAGSDYGGAGGGTLQFAAGESSVSVTMSISDDDVAEGSETLTVTLSSGTEPGGGPVGYSPAEASVRIIDGDVAGVVMSATALILKPGTSQEVQVTMRSEPTAPVRLTFSEDTPGVCRVRPRTVELDAATWQSGFAITVTATGSGTCTIKGAITSDDTAYDGSQTSPLHVVVQAERWLVYLPLVRR
jgi:uncharacterized repeat protein (TIGR01451 family)